MSTVSVSIGEAVELHGGGGHFSNIHSLGGNYGYDGTINRTVAVSTAAVQEALEKIYPAPKLVAELKDK